MKRYLYSALGLFTAYSLIIILFHLSEHEQFSSQDFWMAIIELFVVIIIFIVGETIATKEKREMIQKNRLDLADKTRQLTTLETECGDIKKNISFVSNFEDYCNECKNGIVACENDSNISTIQTPIFLESDNSAISGYFKDYITETARQLLIKNSATDSAKILLYRRLVVINNISSDQEIKEEKNKLNVFVEALYTELANWNNHWKPSLKNIHIGIIKAIDISNSPFSNLDVLLIKNKHLVIAFPLENNNSYMWGTSLHLNNNKGYLNRFDLSVQKFEQIYQKVWDNRKIKKIDFGEIHKFGNLDLSKTNILNAIENNFNSLLTS